MHKISKIRLILIVISVCLVLSVTGCDEMGKLMSLVTGHGPGGPGGPHRPMGPPQVSVVTIKSQKVTLTTKLPGRTAPFRIAQIRPQVSGLILKRLFVEGSNVRTGQALYQIDPAPFQVALDNARAALDQAEANLSATRLKAKRFKELLPDKAVSRQNYDDAVSALKQVEAGIESGKARVESARINLGYTHVMAPISGRIGTSNVTVGAIVTAYQPMALTTIQQLDPIYVDVPESTTELLRLKRNLKDGHLKHDETNRDKVKLILEDGTPYPLEGTLQFSDVTVDPSTGSVILRIVVPNPQHLLLPGMFVEAVIKEGVNEHAILASQQGVSRNRKGNPFALIVDKTGKVGQRMLTLGRAIGDKWLVSSGLTPGDRVIIEGIQNVRPGMAVKAMPFTQNATVAGATVKTAKPHTESH